MPISSKSLRLQSVNLSGSVQMFGITTQRFVDGYNGLTIELNPASGVVFIKMAGSCYALAPGTWSAAEVYDEPQVVAVSSATPVAEPEFERVEHNSERIPVSAIRKRQTKKMEDRITE